jgi:hypothetical protein
VDRPRGALLGALAERRVIGPGFTPEELIETGKVDFRGRELTPGRDYKNLTLMGKILRDPRF